MCRWADELISFCLCTPQLKKKKYIYIYYIYIHIFLIFDLILIVINRRLISINRRLAIHDESRLNKLIILQLSE